MHRLFISIKRILASREPGMIALKYTVVGATAVLGLVNLGYCLSSFSMQFIYRKDFIQEYLLAKALLNGIDPYTPLPELTKRFIGPLPFLVLRNPTPHPPPVALLSFPLAWLTYRQAAIAWFALELTCILLSAYGLLRCLNKRPNALLVLFIALLALAWSTFRDELVIGQLMTINLALLIGAWQMLRTGKEIRGGVLLGSAVALKLIAWPLVIFLFFCRKWRAAGTAVTVLVAANIAAASWMGFRTIAEYYLKVGPLVSSLYRAYIDNFSLWTIGWRVFDGTGSPVLCGINALPPVHAPGLAGYAALIPPIILLGTGLFMAVRASSFDASFGLMICISLLVSPIAWSHYLILISIPLAIVIQRLLYLDLPYKETKLAFLLCLILIVHVTTLNDAILLVANQKLSIASNPMVPFTATLISLIPTAGILGLLWLVRRVDQISFSS